MSEVELKQISYAQLRGGNWLEDSDLYSLAAFVDENVQQTFLQCPNNTDGKKTAVLLAVSEGVVVGRHLLYGTRIKCGECSVMAQSSGSTEVHQSLRGKGVGSRINKWTLNNDEYPIYLCSLLSPSCLSIMSKPENGCIIFSFPQMVKIINTEAAFGCRGFKGGFLWLCKTICNSFNWVLNIPYRIRLSKIKKKYSIKREDHIPEWAEEMCLNDGHKYAEYHDREWLEWNLTHNLSGQLEDKQYFYSVYDAKCIPVGFFMTKIRVRKDIIKYDRMVSGTLCEWATVRDDLCESDINLLALSTFPKNCYQFFTVTNSQFTEKTLRFFGFMRKGRMEMGFRDKLGQFPDMADQKLWRIRYGCCNSILY